MSHPTPKCPLRPGDPCTLCQLNVTGPQDCGLVYLIMDDPDARAAWAAQRLAARAAARDEAADAPPTRDASGPL